MFLLLDKILPLDSCFTKLFISERDTVSPVRFELRIVSMAFKYGRIPAVSKAHLLEFYGIRHLRD